MNKILILNYNFPVLYYQLQYKKDMQNINFPKNTESYLKILTPSDLQRQLEQELRQFNLETIIKYKIRCSTAKYLYASCASCKAKLFYKLNQDKIYQLHKIIDQHHHSKKNSTKQIMLKIMEKIPTDIAPRQLKKIIKSKIPISNSSFYRILNIIRNQPLKLINLVNRFSQQGYIGYFEPNQLSNDKDLPYLLIISTLDCRESFMKYGNVVTFDFTYGLIRQKSSRNRQYRLGILTGFSGNMKIIPYAAVFCDDQSSETVAKIFFQVFRLLGKTPQTVISDQQPSFKSGLNILRYEDLWEGQHLFDAFHVLRNIKKKLSNKQHLQFFRKLIFSRNKNQFSFHQENARRQMSPIDIQILNNLIAEKQFTCFSYTEDYYIGFGVSSSINEKINDLVKTLIPYSQKLLIAAQKIGSFMKKMIHKSTNQCIYEVHKVQKYLHLPQIKQIRQIVCKRVFQEILYQINEALFCLYQSSRQGEFQIQDKYGEYRVQMKQSNKLECQCQYWKKSGIPCSHVIKILLVGKKSLKEYINQRYICKRYEKQQNKIILRKPQKTRRNRIK